MKKQIETNEIISTHIIAGDEFKNDFTALPVVAYSDCKTKSEEIRARSKDGQSRAFIAKAMNIRYQHVRNVLLTPLKKQ